MVLAAFLDPSMQHLGQIKDYFTKNNIDVAEILLDKWQKYELSLSEGKSQSDDKQGRKRESTQQMGNDVKRIRLELIEKHCAASAAVSDSPVNCIRRELSKYTSVIGVLEDPLIWWATNQNQYPYMSTISKLILSFMATSAIVERFFSVAGILMTKHKSNLNPITMQKILFIHENFDLVKEHFEF